MKKIIKHKIINFRINQLFNIAFYIIIFLYLILLISLIGPMRHVDPDFFQFLRDSEYYLKFQLPPFIQSLPANPILIGIFSRLLTNFYTEIEVALLINAIAMSTTIFLTYYILKKETSLWFAGLASLFLITNPIVFGSATSNNSEVLFSMFTLIIFNLLWKKKELLAIFLTALGIAIRYESILLFFSIVTIDFIKNRNLKKSIKIIATFLIPALPIMFILLSRNYSNSVLSTPFLLELFERSEDIPELRFLSNLPFAFFYNKNFLFNGSNLITIVISIIFYLILFFLIRNNQKNNSYLAKISLLFTIFWLIFHALFPAYLERYFVPTIFSLILSITLLMKNQHHLLKKIFFVILLITSIFNFLKIAPHLKIDNQYVMYSPDYFTALSIKTKTQNNEQQYTILSPYPETIAYYYKNSHNISLISIKEIKRITNLDNLANSITEFEKITNQKIIIPYNNLLKWGIFGDYDNSLRKWYESIDLYELGDYIYSNNSCLWHEENYDKDQYINVKLYIPCFIEN